MWEQVRRTLRARFSALQRAEIAETPDAAAPRAAPQVSVLFNEPKLLKQQPAFDVQRFPDVSVLFNEPKLLKH